MAPDEPRPTAGPARARKVDEVAAAAIASADETIVNGWWCRVDVTLPFRRANAAVPPVGAALAEDLETTLRRVEDWYRERGATPRVQVSTADPAVDELDRHLADRGYVVEAPVTVQVAPIATVLTLATGAGRDGPVDAVGSTVGVDPGAPDLSSSDRGGAVVRAQAGIDEAWAVQVADLHGADERARARTVAYGRLLVPFAERGLAATVSIEGSVVAVGFAVVDGDWCGVFGMATAPAARRRGAGRRILTALAEHALAAGATDLYLQLEDHNAPAEALYGGLGFLPSHRYHYRTRLEP